jgi:phosphomannomutase
MKKMVVFDLDGTLVRSKLKVDEEMSSLIGKLLKIKMVSITGGGSFSQFRKQMINYLDYEKLFHNLFLFPTNGASFYRYTGGKWQQQYHKKLTNADKHSIIGAFEKAFKEVNYQNPKRTYGPIFDDRESQITFSALGQKAPIAERQKWNSTLDKRREIKTAMEKYLPEFDVMTAGVTSIDVVKKGINKNFVIQQLMKLFNLDKEEIIFIGDALNKGGNDYAVWQSGVEVIKVAGPEETKKIIRKWL